MELLLRKRDTQNCVPVTAEEVCEHYIPRMERGARARMGCRRIRVAHGKWPRSLERDHGVYTVRQSSARAWTRRRAQAKDDASEIAARHGRPRDVCVMWQNNRCSILFHFDRFNCFGGCPNSRAVRIRKSWAAADC